MMIRTRIEISGIPAYPQDYKVTLITDDRPHQKGLQDELFITDNRVSLVGFDYDDFQYVQALSFKKYILKVVKTESFQVEYIKYGRFIKVYAGSVVYVAKITNVTVEEIEGSDFQNCIIEFYDYNKANYSGGTYIQDYLKSDVIIQRDNPYGIYSIITVVDANTKAYYTYQKPKQYSTAPKEEIVDVNGIDVQTYGSIRKYYEVVFYVGNDDLSQMLYNLPLCDGINSRATLNFDGISAEIIERPTVTNEIISGAVDLFRVTVNFVYESKKIYNYGI